MTIDDLKALAEKAKAWRPALACAGQCHGGPDGCPCCDGAQRACEDIGNAVGSSLVHSERYDLYGRLVRLDADNAHEDTTAAARIASYFGSEANPVAEFAAAVREFCSR